MELLPPEPMPSWPGGCLRPWRLADAERLATAWRDPEIARWNPVPTDPTLERAEAWITGVNRRASDGVSLDLCIVRCDAAISPAGAPSVVGEVGLSGVNERARGAFVGYWLLPEARGRGLATAALDALSVHAFERLGLAALIARCATGNLASHRVAERSGFHHARNDGAGHELWVRRA